MIFSTLSGKQRCVQEARWPGWFPYDFLQIKKYLNFLPRCDPCGSTIAVIDDNGPPCVKMVHSKYLLLNECLTWQKAVKRCNNFQSRLALPKNMDENEDFLADAKNLDFIYGFWIAVTETPEGGSWVDDQGQNLTFTNWDVGFPRPMSHYANNTIPTAVIVLHTGVWRNVPSGWKSEINALCV